MISWTSSPIKLFLTVKGIHGSTRTLRQTGYSAENKPGIVLILFYQWWIICSSSFTKDFLMLLDSFQTNWDPARKLARKWHSSNLEVCFKARSCEFYQGAKLFWLITFLFRGATLSRGPASCFWRVQMCFCFLLLLLALFALKSFFFFPQVLDIIFFFWVNQDFFK